MTLDIVSSLSWTNNKCKPLSYRSRSHILPRNFKHMLSSSLLKGFTASCQASCSKYLVATADKFMRKLAAVASRGAIGSECIIYSYCSEASCVGSISDIILSVQCTLNGNYCDTQGLLAHVATTLYPCTMHCYAL